MNNLLSVWLRLHIHKIILILITLRVSPSQLLPCKLQSNPTLADVNDLLAPSGWPKLDYEVHLHDP